MILKDIQRTQAIVNEFWFILIVKFQWYSQEELQIQSWFCGTEEELRALDVGILSIQMVIEFMTLLCAKEAYE